MTDNTLVKMEVDYSAEVDKAIPEMQSLAAAGKLTEALDQLYALEKQTRTAADAVSTGLIMLVLLLPIITQLVSMKRGLSKR